MSRDDLSSGAGPMPLRTCGVVILDCDGVLVDSERITNALLAELATELGWPLDTAGAIARFKGRDLSEVQCIIETQLGRPLDASFVPTYRGRMAAAFLRDGVPPVPGAPELLDWLDHNGVPHAVASNAPHEKMRLTLGRIACAAEAGVGSPAGSWSLGWYERFEGRRFSAYDVGRWKPDPALFLHAAAALGAEPEACVVVEDSCSGVLAAVAAGMSVIALADLTPAEELRAAGALHICASLADVRITLAASLARDTGRR